ncbi:hypothetical protein Dimus_000958 [Dionaea muscipula]
MLGELCDLDPEIERTLRLIRAKRRLEFNTQSQKEMEDPPPPANHVPAANGAANQTPLREYAAPQVNGVLPELVMCELVMWELVMYEWFKSKDGKFVCTMS